MTKPINTALLSYGMSGEVFHGPLLMANPGFNLSAVVLKNVAWNIGSKNLKTIEIYCLHTHAH